MVGPAREWTERVSGVHSHVVGWHKPAPAQTHSVSSLLIHPGFLTEASSSLPNVSLLIALVPGADQERWEAPTESSVGITDTRI